MTTDTLHTAASTAAIHATAKPRLDLYAPIHKALRHFMLDTLMRVSRLDVFDAAEMDATLGQFDALMTLCGKHLAHENEFVHPAIEARRPGVSRRIADEHVEHQESIDALCEDAKQLRRAAPDQRMALALRLYRHLALFIGENFAHMHYEETVHNAALWSLYSDAELGDLHERLLASLPPEETMEVARWMLPALNPTERAGMLTDIQAKAPAPAFEGLVQHVRPHIDAAGWTKLAPAIGMASAA